jgi:hypothetical protein
MSRYLSIQGIEIIDLDAIELPSNDREILKAVSDRVFADPSVLEPKVPEAAAHVTATFPVQGPHPAQPSRRMPSCRRSQRRAMLEMLVVPRPVPRWK